MATPTTAGRVIIGQGITVKGDIKNCEEVIVRGFFDAGQVEAKTVIVEADGEKRLTACYITTMRRRNKEMMKERNRKLFPSSSNPIACAPTAHSTPAVTLAIPAPLGYAPRVSVLTLQCDAPALIMLLQPVSAACDSCFVC